MNQYKRLTKIIGDDIYKLTNLKVLIIGIGGVGGMALEMLARSGVGNITLVDYDTFEESNLNRQILSLNDNIGKGKVDIGKKRVLFINNKCNVVTYNKKVDIDFLNKLSPDFDYIIDACDDINAKVSLVKYAIKNDIKIISCCGTGNRLNPSLLEITNIWKTEYDPLAKKLRYSLRKENIKYKLPVVVSKEKPVIKSSDYVGSIATVPNTAGILLASYVINDILEKD